MRARPYLRIDSDAALRAAMAGGVAPPALVVDLTRLPEPLPVIASIRGIWPDVPVVAIGVPDVRAAVRCIESGCLGIVERRAHRDRLRAVVDDVRAGNAVCSPAIAHAVFVRLGELARAERRRSAVETMNLTSRQLQILRLIAQELDTDEIAARLFVARGTVKNHVHLLLRRLGVRGRVQAARLAQRRGWFEVPGWHAA